MILGKAHKFGNNIDTDAIIPARYLNTHDPEELAKHVMEDADARFVEKMKVNDIIVAGENFGCGSSREHAPVAIKAAGISAVIAKSFARIFYRNAINIGLPILESKEAVEGIKEGDEIEIVLEKGEIRNVTTKMNYKATPFPKFMEELIDAGGLIEYVRRKIHGKNI
jgi:3-isopropylmalate/(R)-2-methylmalate dehydratase small subunit